MFYSYYYVSLFVPFINISVGLGSLFQRIDFIYDGFYLSRLNKLFEKNQICNSFGWCPKYYFLACLPDRQAAYH